MTQKGRTGKLKWRQQRWSKSPGQTQRKSVGIKKKVVRGLKRDEWERIERKRTAAQPKQEAGVLENVPGGHVLEV